MAIGREHSEYFHRIFRQFVGQGRPFTVETAAELTGITVRTVRGHHAGETAPSYAHLLLYIDLLGPGFANALLGPLGLKVLELDAATAPNHHMTAMSALLADMIRAAEDGVFDHRERKQLAPLLRDVGNECLALAAVCEKGEGPLSVVPRRDGTA